MLDKSLVLAYSVCLLHAPRLLMAIVCLACNQDLVIASALAKSFCILCAKRSCSLSNVCHCDWMRLCGCNAFSVVSLKQAVVYSFEGTDVLPLLSVVFDAFGKERQNPDLRFRQQQMG